MICAVVTGVDSGLYKVLLVAHIVLAIVGFGAVMLNGLYASKARARPGPEGRAISEANYAVAEVAEYVIVSVPLTGIALVWASGESWAFSDLWVWLSLALSIAALVLSRAVVAPGHRRINELLAASERSGTDGHVEEMQRLERIQGAAGGVLGLATVAVVVLMVWKPTG